MDEETYESLQRVVKYLLPEESRHWEESGKPKQHIYKDVIRLKQYCRRRLVCWGVVRKQAK